MRPSALLFVIPKLAQTEREGFGSYERGFFLTWEVDISLHSQFARFGLAAPLGGGYALGPVFSPNPISASVFLRWDSAST